MPSFVHGKNAGFALGTASSPTTTTDISNKCNTASLPFERDMAEASVFGDNFKRYVPGLNDATVSIEGRLDNDVDKQIFDLLTLDAEVSFKYAPAGIGTTGTPLYEGQGYISSYEPASDIGEVNVFSAEFQLTGQPTRQTQ